MFDKETVMQKGIIDWFNNAKGYGFIKQENKSLFIHYTGLENREIKAGDEVEFDIIDGEKGLKAVNCKKV